MWRTLFLVPKNAKKLCRETAASGIAAWGGGRPEWANCCGVLFPGRGPSASPGSAPLLLGYEDPRQGGHSPDYPPSPASMSLCYLQRVDKEQTAGKWLLWAVYGWDLCSSTALPMLGIVYRTPLTPALFSYPPVTLHVICTGGFH